MCGQEGPAGRWVALLTCCLSHDGQAYAQHQLQAKLSKAQSELDEEKEVC